MKPERVIANGQCFLLKRDVLLANGGYAPVKDSFAEDDAGVDARLMYSGCEPNVA